MLLEAATGKFGLRDETVKREIPFDALRLLRGRLFTSPEERLHSG
jgi:hypothetical protein